ncbi:SPT3 Dosage dependent suppressor of Ty-induced promoter mutations-like protein [Mortierella sp. GBA30]|nr:SPT3 Dosage dependent suppressor of Ty-induced promoter mutations-like protein [Mortierella sp. GBA30]
MPPHSSSNLLQALTQSDLAAFNTTFLHQHEESTIRLGDFKKAQLATPEWNNALLYSLNETLGRQVLPFGKPTISNRLNVKTHVFKKELQEYIPTQIEDRLRIETIIYVELSIVDQNNNLVNAYDYARLPKDLFFSQPDKVMSPEEMATKRIVDVAAVLQCPSNGWQEEKEACLRCARRMSTKLDQTESRIMHMLPELHRTENGDALISFRSGIANIQFKINCYCGHKKEKEGFVIRFDSTSDASIASHVTLPLMFYHQNKNRVASRALAAAAKAQSKDEQQLDVTSRSIVKSVNSKTKRESRSKPGHSPIGQQKHQIPSPPNSLLDSPVEWNSSPEMDDFIDSNDMPFTVPSPPPPDPLISLFPDSVSQDQQQQQQQPAIALISHMTPNSGPVRGGTLVTIHGSGFKVGEVMYVCFGENLVPIIPQRDHMLECITPASNKAETVPVFAMNAVESSVAQATFTYVDDNEKELIKLALQRVLSISARMDGPLDNVLSRANEFTMWSELLEGGLDGSSLSSVTSFSNAEKLVLESFKLLDTPLVKNCESLSVVNNTGHTMLHLAVALQYEALVKDLLARGVDLAVQDKNGLTALNLAHRLNSQIMVDLLSGPADCSATETKAAAETKTAVTSAAVAVVGKPAFATARDVVAHGLQSSVSPGSRPSATDQPGAGYGQSGVAHHSDIRINMTPPTKSLTLDLAGHVDPHMDFEWEGFGQGPGRVVTQDNGEGAAKLFADQEGHGIDQHQHQYSKALSAIPVTTGSDEMVKTFAPIHDGEAPSPRIRLPIASSPAGQAGVIQIEHNIAISTSAFAHCPIDSLDPVRLPIGGLDRTAPIGQGVVAVEGRTSVPHSTEADASHGVPGSGSIQSIQGTARIHQLDVRVPIVVGSVADQQQRSLDESGEVMVNNPDLLAEEGGVAVDGVDVDVGNNEGGSHNTAALAAVQSSRSDVDSEPLLFLGGLPVTLSPRSTRIQGTTVLNYQDRHVDHRNNNKDPVAASASSSPSPSSGAEDGVA